MSFINFIKTYFCYQCSDPFGSEVQTFNLDGFVIILNLNINYVINYCVTSCLKQFFWIRIWIKTEKHLIWCNITYFFHYVGEQISDSCPCIFPLFAVRRGFTFFEKSSRIQDIDIKRKFLEFLKFSFFEKSKTNLLKSE